MELFMENPFLTFVAATSFCVMMVQGLKEGIATMYVLFGLGAAFMIVGTQAFISGVMTSLTAGMILKRF